MWGKKDILLGKVEGGGDVWERGFFFKEERRGGEKG